MVEAATAPVFKTTQLQLVHIFSSDMMMCIGYQWELTPDDYNLVYRSQVFGNVISAYGAMIRQTIAWDKSRAV